MRSILLEPASEAGGLAASGAAALSLSHLSPSCQDDRDRVGPRKASSRAPLGVTELSGPVLRSAGQSTLWAWCSLLRPPFDLSELPSPPHTDVTAARPRSGLEPPCRPALSASSLRRLRSRRLLVPQPRPGRAEGHRAALSHAPTPQVFSAGFCEGLIL